MWGRKKRILEFLQYNFKAIDIPLSSLQFNFMDQFNKFNLVQKKIEPNSAMKYCQSIKEIIDRAVVNGWMPVNLFAIFQCTYVLPHREWPTWAQMMVFIDWKYENEELELTRDAAVFMAFTGLAYQEVYTLSPADIITGIDGKKWINKDRQKTDGDETLPLLPIAERMLEKYRDHPVCVKKGRLFPIMTNQAFNKNLKTAAGMAGLNPELGGHDLRYFFANEITFNQGVPLKTISKMLGHKSVKTTEIYVRPNRQNISENMAEVQRKLFNKNGELKVGEAPAPGQAKVITLKGK
jgi:integrase